MEKKFYIYGVRPIFEKVEENYSTFYAFQFDTGEFKEDMTYASKIWSDFSGDAKEFTEEEFNAYVRELKTERGLP